MFICLCGVESPVDEPDGRCVFQRLREVLEAGPAQKDGEQPLIIRHHDQSARRFRGVDAS